MIVERTPPRLTRDPWAWLTLASVLPLVLGTLGTPRGEPVAEDFDFLHRALFEPGFQAFDGGGSFAFWRPVSHQLYYLVFGRLMLAAPGVVAAIHVAMLALAALLLYRALRLHASGAAAFAAASFPLLAESTRTLVCWPSHFVDLGAFLFLGVAIHERAYRRLPSGLVAMLAALLCKELALVGVLLLPFLPDRGPDAARVRRRWLLGAGAVIGVWALTYELVRVRAHLELPHGLERDPALLTAPLGVRLGWALGRSLQACFSLDRPEQALFTIAVAAAIVLAGVLLATVLPGARSRWRERRSLAAWGAAWALGSWIALASIFPLWAPNRSQLGSVGFGIGATALAEAIHPALPLALTAVRTGLFALGPKTPPRISPEPPTRDAFMDYPRLSRLQRLMRETRQALHARFPVLPQGATLATFTLPLSSEYALGGAHAVQAWYGDSTLRWLSFDEFLAHPETDVLALVHYQVADPQVVLVDGAAARAQRRGLDSLQAGRWLAAIDELRRADSLQVDRRAAIFLGDLAGRRAYCLAQLARWDEALNEAQRAVAVATGDVGARYVIAAVDAVHHRDEEALAQLDTLVMMSPRDADALALRQALLHRIEERKPPRPSTGVHP